MSESPSSVVAELRAKIEHVKELNRTRQSRYRQKHPDVVRRRAKKSYEEKKLGLKEDPYYDVLDEDERELYVQMLKEILKSDEYD